MSLTDKLRDLDQKLLPGTREPDEDAETYLRRVAASRAITPAQAGDVMAALRVYFDVQPGAEDAGDEEDGEEKDGEKADDSAGEQKDESDEAGSEDDSENKSEDDS
jgi:hypothetical protein